MRPSGGQKRGFLIIFLIIFLKLINVFFLINSLILKVFSTKYYINIFLIFVIFFISNIYTILENI